METRAEIIARLARQGGYVLLVGGGVSEMGPPYTTHPQILIWDDQVMNGTDRRSIPSNTRAILCTKWINHALVGRLQKAATQIHSIIFPMLTKREMREMLTDMIGQGSVGPVVMPGSRVEMTDLSSDIDDPYREGIPIQLNEDAPLMESGQLVDVGSEPVTVDKGYLTGDEIMRPVNRGEHDTILAAELGEYEFVGQRARELVPIYAKKYGIKVTWQAIAQAIFKFEKEKKAGKVKSVSKPASQSVTKPVVVTGDDDFSEAERILKEARAAIDLMLDFMPKLKKEMNTHRKRMEKLKAFFTDDE
jgi:hypothetical protein